MLDLLLCKIHNGEEEDEPSHLINKRVLVAHDIVHSLQKKSARVFVAEANCYMDAEELKQYFDEMMMILRSLQRRKTG
jgi:hypothetical protein